MSTSFDYCRFNHDFYHKESGLEGEPFKVETGKKNSCIEKAEFRFDA